MRRLCLLTLLCIAAFPLGGCSSLLIDPALQPLVQNLGRQSDPELVCEGAPTFLLAIDSLLASDPGNRKLLAEATRAYTAYAGLVPECGRPERAMALANRAREYGLRLLAAEVGLVGAAELSLAEFEAALARIQPDAAESLFWGGYGWAASLDASKGAPAALAELPKIERLMQRVVALNEGVSHGGAHLFLGISESARPVLLGGRPEVGRWHFERAIALSERRFLPTLVAYAEYYAKTTLDRELFERLLHEVLAFDPALVPELTLANVLARRRAKRLLAEADEYF